MGKSRAGSDIGTDVNVSASSAGPRRAFQEFDDIPQTTCFGMRRKPSVRKARSEQMRQDMDRLKRDTGARHQTAEGSTKDAISDRRTSSPTPSRRLCGAGSILRSFSSIRTDILVTDPSALHKAPKDVLHGPTLQSCPDDALETRPSTIMASYENIMESKAGLDERGEERDGDRDDGGRDDGADSLEEEEDTFVTPCYIVDPHDIYFISKNDGSGKVCKLGKGDFGPVYLGVWKDHEVAVKLARQKPIGLKHERNFQKHIARLHALDHPNVVPLLGACCWKGGKRSVLVTEYMDKADLRTLLGREELTAKFAWDQHGQTVALDIAQGLAYLHRRGVVHGRLKAANVLMNKAGIAKLSDPSLLKLLSHCKDLSIEKSSSSSGNRHAAHNPSLAPEVTPGTEPTYAADVYAFGVLLWELLTLEKADGAALRSIRTPEEAPAKISYLVECCLAENPSQRPPADSIVTTLLGK